MSACRWGSTVVRWSLRRCAFGLLLAASAAQAAPEALIGILQGQAVLTRQSTRYTLVEGTALEEGDIVETGKGAFAQLEFADGTLVGLGESTRLIVKPRLTALKTAAPPRFFLLDGWAKLRLPAKPEGGFGVLSTGFELDGKSGAAVVRVQPKAWAVFAEAGTMRTLQRDGGKAVFGMSKGDFVALKEGSDKPAASTAIAPDFLQGLPRGFRDPLPARGELFTKKQITLQPLGLVSYDDVSPWLHTEPGIRLALSKQWRGRGSDKAFKAAAGSATNLSAHPEWERVLFPERFLPKKPPVAASAALPPASAASY